MGSGIRSWIRVRSPTASVVRMVHDSSASGLSSERSRQTDHSPAMYRRSPSGRDMKYGSLTTLGFFPPPDPAGWGSTSHSYHPSIGTRQRRYFTASRKDGSVAALSALALNSGLPFTGIPGSAALL